MRSAEEIVELFRDRLKASSPLVEMMRQMRDLVNGDVMVPLPEMDEAQKPAVANLIAEAVDQTSMRVASTMPNLLIPPLNPRNERSREKADKQRRGTLGYWQHSKIKRVNRRRARHLSAYGTAAVIIRPDFQNEMPQWQLRDPLHTFPSLSEFYDDDCPSDVIFAYRRPLSWLQHHYPEAWQRLRKGVDPKPDTPFELVEYVDEHCIKLIAVGVKDDWRWQDSLGDMLHGEKAVELEYLPNRAEICTAVVPKRVTLDRIAGQFTQLTGMYQAQARLMALELIAVEKAIFPDLVLQGREGRTPTLVNGEWFDGRSGRINIVKDGVVDVVQSTPGFKTGEAIDRLEAAQRSTGAIPAQWGGEQPTNIRTGRAAEITMSAAVDFRIQEYQETLAEAMMAENRRAFRVARGYFGDRPKSFHIAFKNGAGPVDFIPERDFETDESIVSFPMPGADANAMVVAMGQRLGLGLISRETARWLDPLIEDPDLEGDKAVAEGLQQAAIASLQQMAAQGTLPAVDLARIEQLIVEENVPLYKAILKAQEDAQARQATPAPEGSPETQPGMALPGMGAEQPVEEVGEPEPSLFNLKKLLMSLAQPETEAGGATPPMVAA